MLKGMHLVVQHTMHEREHYIPTTKIKKAWQGASAAAQCQALNSSVASQGRICDVSITECGSTPCIGLNPISKWWMQKKKKKKFSI